ncbi:MAG: hypothetical protein HYT67_00910 [Candidatus Yanofskybacteria bacterium]|nr:hypothetical protein [Candidatus Yanofskybacteria bacterium]
MSLLGYFWLLNSLNFLDAFVTVLGIEMDVFYESNSVVNFFLDNFGLNNGMFIVKAGVFVLTAVMLKLHQPGSNFVRNCYIALIVFYSTVISYTMILIIKASNV